MPALAPAGRGIRLLQEGLRVEKADIQALPFADDSFDRVVIEAVIMFVDRTRSAREVMRISRPGGRVLEHEFIYRTPSPPEIRRTIEGEVCGGVRFDTAQEWTELYEAAGLRDARLARSTQGSTNRAS